MLSKGHRQVQCEDWCKSAHDSSDENEEMCPPVGHCPVSYGDQTLVFIHEYLGIWKKHGRWQVSDVAVLDVYVYVIQNSCWFQKYGSLDHFVWEQVEIPYEL
jgi:hypothetical protein